MQRRSLQFPQSRRSRSQTADNAPGQAGQNSPKGRPSLSELTAPALQFSALFAAFLYLTGWIYLYKIYSHFRVEPGVIGFSTQESIAQGAIVLSSTAVQLLSDGRTYVVAILAGMIFYYAGMLLGAPRWPAYLRARPGIVYLVGLALVLLVTTALISIAERAAHAKVRSIRFDSHEYIQFAWKKDCEPAAEIVAANDQHRLRFVSVTPQWYFVFAENGERIPETRTVTLIDVYHMPVSCILSATIEKRKPRPSGILFGRF